MLLLLRVLKPIEKGKDLFSLDTVDCGGGNRLAWFWLALVLFCFGLEFHEFYHQIFFINLSAGLVNRFLCCLGFSVGDRGVFVALEIVLK